MLCGCSPGPLKLSAPPGQYQAVDLGVPSETASIALKVSLTAFERDAQWPPAAYVGFYQGANRNKSVQFMITRNKQTDNYMVVGYRVIEEGQEAKIVSLENIALNKAVDISMSFSKGTVILSFNHGQPIEVHTNLTVVTPYASVSSGTANFDNRISLIDRVHVGHNRYRARRQFLGGVWQAPA